MPVTKCSPKQSRQIGLSPHQIFEGWHCALSNFFKIRYILFIFHHYNKSRICWREKVVRQQLNAAWIAAQIAAQIAARNAARNKARNAARNEPQKAVN
jgi:hypothetical protein